jgi:hypothetical protein
LLINVRNDLPYVATVRVVVIGGESVGLTASDPGAQIIPAGRSQQFKIETKVVKAGKFPLDVQLIAADGSQWSDPTTITVSSSAYGTLTIVLIAVAGGALFLMVVIRLVQRIRNRNGPSGVGPTDEGAALVASRSAASSAQPDSILGAANAPPLPTTPATVGGHAGNPLPADASSQQASRASDGDEARPDELREPGRSAGPREQKGEGEQ